MNLFGLYIGSSRAVVIAIREASIDAVRGCERLAEPRGMEREGDYGRGRADAMRDIRKLGDDLVRDLNQDL